MIQSIFNEISLTERAMNENTDEMTQMVMTQSNTIEWSMTKSVTRYNGSSLIHYHNVDLDFVFFKLLIFISKFLLLYKI